MTQRYGGNNNNSNSLDAYLKRVLHKYNTNQDSGDKI